MGRPGLIQKTRLLTVANNNNGFFLPPDLLNARPREEDIVTIRSLDGSDIRVAPLLITEARFVHAGETYAVEVPMPVNMRTKEMVYVMCELVRG